MRPEERRLLQHMLDAAETVREFVHAKTSADFVRDVAFQSSVYWQLMIIGEALSQLRQISPALAEQITESHRIVAFRNQIVHGYALVDHETTWDITQVKVPVLIVDLQRVLATR